jgi:branched-subunit amino acid ABC-type transport system permease component
MVLSHLTAVALSVVNSIALLIIVSVGLAVIFGMMGLINLAHGEFLMLGAYMTVTSTGSASASGSPPSWVLSRSGSSEFSSNAA